MSERSCLDKSGAILTNSGGGPASPHCISSRAAKTFKQLPQEALETVATSTQPGAVKTER